MDQQHGRHWKARQTTNLYVHPVHSTLLRLHYQMPTIEEIIPEISKVFSVLNTKDIHWQVKLDEAGSYLTTFWTPISRYRWLWMHFGIKPAAGEYQRRQREALQGLKGLSVIVEDILPYGCGGTNEKKWEQATADPNRNHTALLQRARDIHLKLNTNSG